MFGRAARFAPPFSFCTRYNVHMSDLVKSLANVMKGEVTNAKEDLDKMSRDTSIFSRRPLVVVYPKDAEDVSVMVKELVRAREAGAHVSVTARAAGTCMSGGPLTKCVVASFTKHMNHVTEVTTEGDAGYAVTEPGVFYRDFEKATLEKGLILPSYPASREIAAMGGLVANNSGGERTLEYGKTEKYIEELEVVLSDGSEVKFKPLSPSELQMKKVKQDLEGKIYQKMDDLLTQNEALIAAHKPKVSKNSAGYALWSVRNPEDKSFNLSKLICGSQGTLALWTSAKLRLVKPKEHRAMLVVFLTDLNILPEIVNRVLPFHPESFESYDDHTFTLAIKFLPEMLSQMGWAKAARLGISFIPEAELVLTGGVPKMVLMAEFAEDTIEEADKKAVAARAALEGLPIKMKIEKNEQESEKFWIVRRESFRLLRQNLHGLYASPFIDDFVVLPETYATFLPELNALLAEYSDKFIYTIAGHIGNGNFHIIPLMDLGKPEIRQVILELAPKVYKLVVKYGGTITGEHNDGIIRTPFLPLMFGPEMIKLFEQTKKIFDPHDIFNPNKKVHGTFDDIRNSMITHV
jgi:FAD/FMN-containing dehydrogenase